MKVFLSHARKDITLASKLAALLRRRGFTVWMAEEQIVPGDNWAKKVGKALDETDLLVVLLTPGAMEADTLRRDIDFALGARRFEGRLFTVFVGPPRAAGKAVPWILLRLPYKQVGSAEELAKVVKAVQRHAAAARVSTAHA
jgi:hypothetical protein